MSETRLIPIEEAKRFFPVPPSKQVLWKWRTVGVKVGKRRVKLNTTKIGGRRYVTEADVQQFIDAQNGRSTSAIREAKALIAELDLAAKGA